MRFALPLFALLACVAPVIAQDVSFESQVKLIKDATQKEVTRLQPVLEKLESDFKLAKKGKIKKQLEKPFVVIKKTCYFRSREDRDATKDRIKTEIEETKAKLKGIKDGTIYIYPELNVQPPKIGAIGSLRAEVFQVTEKRQAIVDVHRSTYQGTTRKREGNTSFNVPHYGRKTVTLVVDDVSTDGMIDDEMFDFGPVEIVGTATYTTTRGGSRTVFAAKPFDQKRIK